MTQHDHAPPVLIRVADSYLRERSVSHVIHLGVTGLRQSGKTVFLTALAYQLTQCGSEGLDSFGRQKVELFPGKSLLSRHASQFPFERNLLMLQDCPARWPEPTTSESELAIEVVYRDRRPSTIRRLLRRSSAKVRRIRVHLHDYPGEYLLDVDMLRRGTDYGAWSREALARIAAQNKEDCAEYVRQCRQIDESAQACSSSSASDAAEATESPAPRQLAAYKQAYAELLVKLRNRGFEMLQPGMALAGLGEKDVAEIGRQLPFVPLPAEQGDSLRPVLAEAFQAYKRDRVRPFVKRLGRCDRQLVLVDVLRVLRNGLDCYEDTRKCLSAIIEAYTYSTHRWRRLAARLPGRLKSARGIRRVVLAATKADHATKHDRANLSKLLDQLAWRFKGAVVTADTRPSLFFASLRSTKDVEDKHNGVPLAALEGRLLQGETDEAPRPRFPGNVPDRWDMDAFCVDQRAFPDFRPWAPSRLSGIPWPHLNLGTVIWTLLFE